MGSMAMRLMFQNISHGLAPDDRQQTAARNSMGGLRFEQTNDSWAEKSFLRYEPTYKASEIVFGPDFLLRARIFSWATSKRKSKP